MCTVTWVCVLPADEDNKLVSSFQLLQFVALFKCVSSVALQTFFNHAVVFNNWCKRERFLCGAGVFLTWWFQHKNREEETESEEIQKRKYRKPMEEMTD